MKKFYTFTGYSLIATALIYFLLNSFNVYSQVQQLSGTMLDDNQVNAGNPFQSATWRTVAAYHTADGDNLPTAALDLHGFVVGALQLGFDGTAWDRIRIGTIGDNGTTTGIQNFSLGLLNGSGTLNTWRDATQDVLSHTGVALVNSSFLSGTAPSTSNRAESANGAGDQNDGNRFGPALPMYVNGTGSAGNNDLELDRQRSASIANLTATTISGVGLATPISGWSETDSPAAATQATASKAAGAAGVAHVAISITGCIEDTDSAAGTRSLRLRDGASGAGTVLRTWYLNFPAANDSKCIDVTFPGMIGTAATAMTLEFGAAGTANSLETVTLTGYSVN